MLYAIVVSSYICLELNAYFSGKVISYGIWEQIKDVIPAYILSILVGVITYFSVTYFTLYFITSIIAMIMIYTVLYVSISKLLKFEALDIYLSIINERIFKQRN